MKILLDVGANTGQTARAALNNRYSFDRIVCFEPAHPCWTEIERIEDPRVELCKFGLWNANGQHTLYNPGSLSGSLFLDTTGIGTPVDKITIELQRASDWFGSNIFADDTVFMKLNCEGSECDIVEDLLDSGRLQNVYSVMIDFDVRKIRSMRKRELVIRRKLRAAQCQNVAFSEDVMFGESHEARICSWLDTVGAHENLSREELRQKYGPILSKLSSRSGRLARLEEGLRRTVFSWLPSPLKSVVRYFMSQVRWSAGIIRNQRP